MRSIYTAELFERLTCYFARGRNVTLAARGAPDPTALADLSYRYDTDQLSTLVTRA